MTKYLLSSRFPVDAIHGVEVGVRPSISEKEQKHREMERFVYAPRIGDSDGKESACQCRSPGLDPDLGRSAGGGHGNPQYSCPGNPKDRGAWRATVHGITKESDIAYQLHYHRYHEPCVSRSAKL